jgi:hypothetical protein
VCSVALHDKRYCVQAHAYVKAGLVKATRHVEVLESTLTGIAAKFWRRYVSMDPLEWTLDRFVKQMFNYCFPPDWFERQRILFEKCRQGNRSV